jgi:hypothetical protein
MMAVDMKSRAESTREASTESEDDVNATMSLAMRRKTFAAKFTKMAMATTRVWPLELG